MLVCTIEIFINERTNLVGKIGGGTVLLFAGIQVGIYLSSKPPTFVAETVHHVRFLYFRLSVLPARTGVAGSQAHHQAR